ncbi:MAG: GNAT family N-acetyltransferase [Lachnospiraceae bacterium]
MGKNNSGENSIGQNNVYRIRAVLFDTIAACRNLKECLQNEGIRFLPIVFGLHEETSLMEAVQCLGVCKEECLLITNSKRHAEVAKRLSMVCVGCMEGTYELPKVATLLESPDEVSVSYLNMVYCHEKGIPAVIMETERCIVRELTLQEASELYAISSKPQVNRYLAEPVGTPEEEAEKLSAYIRTVYPFFGYGFWGVYEKESGKLIGKAGFKEGSMPLEVGYLFDNTVWGKGIATEVLKALVRYAKEELNACELIARIHPENTASRRVAEKCDVRIETM